MTPIEFRTIRNELGLSLKGTARLFRMGAHGYRNIQRWEAGEQDIPGWAGLVFDILRRGKQPNLDPFRRKHSGRPKGSAG